MTTEAHERRRSFLIGKAKPNAIVGRNRETGELAILVLGCALAMIAGFVVPTLALKIITIVGLPTAAAGIVFMPYRKRTVYRWFEIDRSYRRMLRSGAARYGSAAVEAGTRLGGDELAVPGPPGVGRIRWLTANFGPDKLAVLMHLDRGTVTCTLEIEGPGVGSRDAEDQEALVDRFGTLLRHVANGDGFVTRLQMLARTLPADPDAHAKDVMRRGDPEAAQWLRDSYDHLLSMVSTSSEQHRAYLTACMPYSRELAAEARVMGGGVDGDHGLCVIMVREMSDICARLTDADIKVRQPLDVPALSSLIHSMYDPEHPIDHSQAMTERGAWPAEFDASAPLFLRAKTRESAGPDPWCHATAWIRDWPLTPVTVNFLAPLLVHTPDVIRTVAVTMDLEPTEVAIERMLTEKVNVDAESARAAKMGRIDDPRERAHSSRVDLRGEDLAAGAAGVNLVGYITVSSRSPEALARDKRTIRASAGKSFLKLEWCDREHHRAFINTLPLATGVRR
ncbi:MAG TPA: SCO6880 family protein [Actinocrinis sp.]|jgi:hypothetical protein|uniref:SCO6880 family protein n=1 Tax=Actinocrinis sp. TaxID=1920516 RepID=UPI002DDDB5BB|nr:SCO6880 family protein [Actinocrinis sp.]HEV3169370.1 SCO6880 family protein [Actinocrinis sp.]